MLEPIIDAARFHWALGDTPITLITARENHVYRIDKVAAIDGPAVLRLHRPGYRSNEEINSELLWMEMLGNHGIAVPIPVPTTDGKYTQVVNGTVVDLLTWIDTVPLSGNEPPEQYYVELGRLMANMHKLADNWESPVEFTRPTWELVGDNPSWGRFWENPLLTSAQSKKFLEFRDDARNALVKLENQGSLDFGLIHADLVSENVLSNGTQLHPIDFDDGGYGYRLFDLATATRQCKRQRESQIFIKAMIAGYREVRPLNTNALPLFEALRASTYVGWNISRLEEPDGRERNGRYVAEAEKAIDAFVNCQL